MLNFLRRTLSLSQASDFEHRVDPFKKYAKEQLVSTNELLVAPQCILTLEARMTMNSFMMHCTAQP